MRKIVVVVILFLSFINLHVNGQYSATKAYIKKYKDVAIREMKRTGIPASITLAQGILESNNGQSRLAKKANNHFGIKCHSEWSGRKIYHDDDEKHECFRKYRNAELSYRDHSDFIKNGNRYAFLFKYKITDYKSWARGLKKAGYATEKKYDELLIEIIEDYNLNKYDTRKGRKKDKKKGKELADVDNFSINPFKEEIQQINRINCIIAKKGDTFYSFSRKFGLTLKQLYKYNELEEGAILKTGEIIYLQPKRRKAAVGNKKYVVKPGDTMYLISQKFGVKQKKLYKKNNMNFGEKVVAGQEIYLRKRKSE